MPLPKPKDGESKQDFLDRCMANDTMNSEYPDNDQRYAVCLSQWKEKEKDSLTPLIEQRFSGNSDLAITVRASGAITSDNELGPIQEEKRLLTGHAAVFNQLSEELGWLYSFREKIAPGAFADVLTDDVRALFNHDENLILGRTTNGTLRLSEDEVGLYVEIDPPDTQLGRDLLLSIRRGDVNQMSFAFTIKSETWENVEDHNVIRTINKVERLYDVSPVTYPAYPQTDISARRSTDCEYVGLTGYRQLGLKCKGGVVDRIITARRRLSLSVLELG